MQIYVHSEVPSGALEPEIDDLPTHTVLTSELGVIVHVRGEGTATVYVELDGAWRAHPQGRDITDDGSFKRLVVGAAGTRRVCVVGDAEAAYLSEVRF